VDVRELHAAEGTIRAHGAKPEPALDMRPSYQERRARLARGGPAADLDPAAALHDAAGPIGV
jgi:hypothetical protein